MIQSFTVLLTVLFIGLKLIGVIKWSWWIVISPIWIVGVIGILFGLALVVGWKIWGSKV